ncbi:MAG: hypothetical protein GX605_13265, partial [Chloroflexi bacterium]|nr:hypothetical protein [Chloroflexota bacterium]
GAFTLGDKQFWKTDDLTIHATVPMPIPLITHSITSLVTQLENISRSYPVRDGWGILGSDRGVQAKLALTQICDGTTSLWYCKKDTDSGPQTGFEWDLIQDKYSGQAVAQTYRSGPSDEENATDDGSTLSWKVSSLGANAYGGYRFVTMRIGPGLAVGANIVNQVTLDSADQTGSPDASTTVTITIGTLATCPLYDAAAASDAALETAASPLEAGLASEAAAPSLSVSASCRLLVDADLSGTPTSGDIVVFHGHMGNNGASAATNCTLTLDYDQTRIRSMTKGGLLLYNSAGQVLTTTVPGVWLDFGGWENNIFEAPLDDNYNGLIDASELPPYVVEFFDVNPTTGQETRSTTLANLSRGEVIRSFVDKTPYNGHYDSGETRASFLTRGMEGGRLLKGAIPQRLMAQYNQSATTDAVHSGLWIWPTMNPFHGPGQGWGTSMWVEIAPSRPSGAIQQPSDAVLHEFGHSNYQVDTKSPNVSPSGHTVNQKVSGETVAYDILNRQAFAGSNLPTIMWYATQGEANDTFFEGYEYGDLAKRQNARFTSTAQESDYEGEVLVVHGTLFADGRGVIADAYPATGMRETAAQNPSEFALALWSAGAEPLLWWPLEVSPLARAERGAPAEAGALSEISPQEMVFFSTVCPLPPETQRVALMRGDEMLATLGRSANAPQVRVVTPNGGERFRSEGQLHVAWEASDPDRDRLTFSILYSPDGGATWDVLASGMSGRELTHPLVALAGASNALIEVRVSDGFRQASDLSDGVFAVGRKPPLGAAILQ